MSRPTESPEEELARPDCVEGPGRASQAFRGRNGSRQVDALIHYPDREAALEVVADHDPDYN